MKQERKEKNQLKKPKREKEELKKLELSKERKNQIQSVLISLEGTSCSTRTSLVKNQLSPPQTNSIMHPQILILMLSF